MGKYNVDTTRMYECGANIIRLSNQLNTVLEQMYKRINNMNVVTQEWVGESANRYITKLNNDRIAYNSFNETLFQYGSLLQNSAMKLESTANSLRI